MTNEKEKKERKKSPTVVASPILEPEQEENSKKKIGGHLIQPEKKASPNPNPFVKEKSLYT